MPKEKLVRDRIPGIIRKSGEPCEIDIHYRKAHPEEMRDLLVAKLREEVDEYISSNSPLELADVMEAVVSLALIDGVDFDGLNQLMHEKRLERGGFFNRFVLFMGGKE